MSSSKDSPGCSAPSDLAARVLLLLVEAYRALLSPLLGGHCRFFPSCSVYALEALRAHGAVRGSVLTLGRLMRCRPFSSGGIDLVPQPPAPTPPGSSSRS